MNLVSIRIITDHVERLVEFYEQVTGISAAWAAPVFAELASPSGTLAIAGTETVALFGVDSARSAENRTVIIEFRVDDVDAEFDRLKAVFDDFVQIPTKMPWGNRSLLIRDPDGNLVNLFTPVAAEAIERQAR